MCVEKHDLDLGSLEAIGSSGTNSAAPLLVLSMCASTLPFEREFPECQGHPWTTTYSVG